MTPLATSPERAPIHKTLRILYADDMLELRKLAEIVLTREGHTLECVPDGDSAFERIAANPAGFDVLITDHHMPKLSGLELVTRVREVPFSGKIVVVSSELSPAVHTAYEALKVNKVLHKPVLPSQLKKTLAEL